MPPPGATLTAVTGDAHNSDPRGRPAIGAVVAIAVGNTRARAGAFRDAELVESRATSASSPEGCAHAVGELARAAGDDPAIVLSSVNPAADAPIVAAVESSLGTEVMRIGRDVPLHVRHALDDDGARTVGQDRLLNAIGAYARTRQATVIVDAGTAVTVDFVDGVGTFHGGAIAPGLGLMLGALHERTAQLPSIAFEMPDPATPFGVNTPDAMRRGVLAAVRGLVRHLTEAYADHYDAFPQIVATGGDMAVLEGDEVIEHFVPDLQLIGIQAACQLALEAETGGPDPGS